MPLLDELASGLPSAGAHALKIDFAVDHTVLAFIVLVVPQLGAFLEAPLIALADRRSRPKVIALGLAGMSATLLACALAPNPIIFGVAFALYGPMSGLATSLAQASLMDADPDERERRMTHWAFSGLLGDIAAPLIVGSVGLAGLSWRGAFLAGAFVLALSATAAAFGRAPGPKSDAHGEAEDEACPAITWRQALGRGRLIAWLAGAALCALLDETLAAFAVVFVRDTLGGGPLAETMLLAAFTVTGALGLAICDRLLLRRDPLAILAWSSFGCALAYVGWLRSTSIAQSIAAFAIVGLFVSPLYPIAKAQAYRAIPDRSGLVGALSALFLPLDLGAPLLLGFVADRAGIRWALALLVLQPLGLLLLAWAESARAKAAARQRIDHTVPKNPKSDEAGRL